MKKNIICTTIIILVLSACFIGSNGKKHIRGGLDMYPPPGNYEGTMTSNTNMLLAAKLNGYIRKLPKSQAKGFFDIFISNKHEGNIFGKFQLYNYLCFIGKHKAFNPNNSFDFVIENCELKDSKLIGKYKSSIGDEGTLEVIRVS